MVGPGALIIAGLLYQPVAQQRLVDMQRLVVGRAGVHPQEVQNAGPSDWSLASACRR
jgi:hypothetical protein